LSFSGCSYGAAEKEAKQFIEQFNLPFLATPMGKGTLDDRHPLSVGAARSTALQDSDCIILLGARLNWMLHFGKPPRFNPNVKIIQVNFYFLLKLIFGFLDIFRLILIQMNYIIIFKVH